MVNNSLQLDHVFHSLADGTRREILRRVAKAESTITELAEPFDMTLAAVSKHIRVLEKAGLVRRTRFGRIHRCRLDPKPLDSAMEEIEFYKKFWAKQFEALEKFLDSNGDAPKHKHKPKKGDS